MKERQSEKPPMVFVPTPLLFQYIERSTMIFPRGVREVTRIAVRPLGIMSLMLKV